LTNTNADGTAVTPDGGLSILLTGGNNGSGFPGTTDLTMIAARAGVIQFDYSYASLDPAPFDFSGYLLGSIFTQLTDTDGVSGSATFNVAAGELFGFRVGTTDNIGEPGILTISNFSAPVSETAAPEPGSFLLLLAGAIAVGAAHRWKTLAHRGKESRG
jgi:hypothetical protein